MKTKFLIIVLMIFSALGFSQEIRTLSSNDGSETKTTGGYGGPLIQTTNINNDWGMIIGGKGGFIFNRKLAFGGIGKALVSTNNFSGDNLLGDENASLNMSYAAGGVFIEYIFNIESPIHFSIPINLMAGGITVEDAASENLEIESSGIFVIEPGINVEFNASQTFIPAINISYRQVFGSSLVNLSNDDISGVNIGLVFKFGKF